MASPFQKYQGEQVQQIPSGYVEAMGSMGKAYASIGQSVAGGIQEAQKRADEEAKLQGALAPYLKNDNRTKQAEQGLKDGILSRAEDGSVIVTPGMEDIVDPNKVKPVIDFYNQTGGDGSKLSGRDLLRFASSFESEKKYEADIAGRERVKLETEKARAEIDAIKAKADADRAKVYGGQVVGAFASGADIGAIPAFQPVNISPSYNAQPTVGGATAPTSPSVDTVVKFNQTPATSPTAIAPAPTAATQPVAPAVAPAKQAIAPVAPVTQADLISPTNVEPIIRIQREVDYENTRIDQTALKKINELDIQSKLAISKAPNESDSITKITKAQQDLIAQQATTSKEINNRRLIAAQEELKLRQGVVKSKTEAAAEGRAVSAEARATTEAAVKAKEARIKFGEGTPTVAEKPTTFAARQKAEIDTAVPADIRGTARMEEEDKVFERQQKILESHPASWTLGIFSPGARQYQFDLQDRPSAAPISPSIRQKLQENIDGYSESQTFLTGFKKVVDGTDDNAIKNYLNRFQAITGDPESQIAGEMASAFGVASFRKAIVSGGNFSDADRMFVKDIVADINTKNPTKDKAYIQKQVERLAKFVDEKFRAGFKGANMEVDLPTSKKFLEREGDGEGLKKLAESEQFYRDFGITIPGTSSKPAKTAAEDVSNLERTLKVYEEKGLGESKAAKDIRSEIAKLKSNK